jgi:hypothetical protein
MGKNGKEFWKEVKQITGKRKTVVSKQISDNQWLEHFNPFTAEVAIMRLLGSAPKSHLCDQKRRSKVTGMSDLMTLH